MVAFVAATSLARSVVPPTAVTQRQEAGNLGSKMALWGGSLEALSPKGVLVGDGDGEEGVARTVCSVVTA